MAQKKKSSSTAKKASAVQTKKAPAAQVQQNGVTMEETLNRWEEFIEKNKTAIIAVVCAIIVAAVGISLYKTKVVEPRELRVSEYLFPGENYFMDGQYQKALEGDGSSFLGFEEIAANYRNTKAGKLAGAYAGLCLAQLDSCELAIKYLSKYKGKDQMIAPAVLSALADCYASTDQLQLAASTFQKAAKKADNDLLSPLYLFNAGLIYEAMEQPSQALKLYNSIKSDYPASREASNIDAYITRLTSK